MEGVIVINDNSILNDIKSLCGIPEDVLDFDGVLIININTIFSGLAQMGLKPDKGFYITDANCRWSDVINPTLNLHNIKSYIYLKVKLLFDPPANATLINSMETQAKELEWRIGIELEEITGGGVEYE